MTACSALVSLRDVGTYTYSYQMASTEVRLAHYTVQEYLLSDHNPLKAQFTLAIGHARLAKGCLVYLSDTCDKAPLTKEKYKDRPLARYSAEYWWQHLRKLQNNIPEELMSYSESILVDQSRLSAWAQIFDVDCSPHSNDLAEADRIIGPPVYYATLLGIPELVHRVIARGCDVNAKGGSFGTALHGAAHEGHTTMVKLLLDNGADPNAQGSYFGGALLVASVKGYEEIVKLLLAKGAEVNGEDSAFASPLQAASKRNHHNISQMLLEKGASARRSQLKINTAR